MQGEGTVKRKLVMLMDENHELIFKGDRESVAHFIGVDKYTFYNQERLDYAIKVEKGTFFVKDTGEWIYPPLIQDRSKIYLLAKYFENKEKKLRAEIKPFENQIMQWFEEGVATPVDIKKLHNVYVALKEIEDRSIDVGKMMLAKEQEINKSLFMNDEEEFGEE